MLSGPFQVIICGKLRETNKLIAHGRIIVKKFIPQIV